jgi:putative effector of murein hydrolase
VAIALLIIYLKSTDTVYSDYQSAGKWLDFWLKPTIVALGVPLYQQIKTIQKQLIPILVSQLAGCVVGIISVVTIAHLLGASNIVQLSMAPKSVTTPIAMEIASSLGGIPALAAAVVIFAGLVGAIGGYTILRWAKIDQPISQAIAMGTASHALGTAFVAKNSLRQSAYASLALSINGIFTALLTPSILSLLPW